VSVRIAALDLAGAVDSVLAVQAQAFGLTRDAVTARRLQVARQAGFAGLQALGCFDGAGAIVGFAYGYPSVPGTWWRAVVEPDLGAAGHASWLRDAFEVAEVHVLPASQGRGLGEALVRQLLHRASGARAVLTAVDAETRARRLYHRLGFVDLARPVRFPGHAEPYVVMGATLPLPRATP
jgi:ribosomal protein S18 acetylase RimI-like enzyme